jgi:flagellar P-ring protein precursor FlgI
MAIQMGKWLSVLAAAAVLGSLWAAPAHARTALKSICRVKGQEEITLQGMGVVVGLKGTGDGGSFTPTIRALARMMQLMGRPTSADVTKDLKDVKNMALVTVTAIIPAAGARQGDKLDCVVSAVAAKSLAGGRLFATPLMARPDPKNPRVLAFAEGAIALDDPTLITTGRVHGGCRLEEDFYNAFVENDHITLVLDTNHADFEVARDVTETINNQFSVQNNGLPLARAVNQGNIEVFIPPQYREDPVLFVSQVLGTPILEPATGARVVINERSGSIVISGDVEIGAVVITHKNIVVETGATGSPTAQFRAINMGDSPSPRLKSLVESLNALHVPADDVIDIIKGIDRNGKLHAQLIIE